MGFCCFMSNFNINQASVQSSSVPQSSLTLRNPVNLSTPGLPVHHQLPEFTQTHVHRVSDAIQPSHSLSLPSPPALNLSQHQGLFQWVSSFYIRWPKYWSFRFSISPSNEHSGMISFGIDWSPCYPRGSQESSPAPQFKSISFLALHLLYLIRTMPKCVFV